MPDRSDVEQSLAEAVALVLYPNGSAAESLTGDSYRVYRGWPVSGSLEADLMQGIAHVSVLPVAGAVRDTTRYSTEWQGSSPKPTLSVGVASEIVTFAGAGGGGQVAGILVDGIGYAYRSRDGDSASLVAAALAMQIRGDRPAVASGSNVYLTGARRLIARVVSDGQGGRELRRQVSTFRVTAWCPTPSLRDVVGSSVDVALADRPFLDVGGWACRARLASESSSDEGAAAGIWRRDLVYAVEYPTVLIETLPAMLFGVADVNGSLFLG